jgi:glutamyl-tRNA synthetase
MSVRVRFAPSPTGFLHIGGVHTALFNWLFARHEGGDFHLRIENTDTSREVAEATQQIQDSLSWIGLDWDGEVTFQLDRMERCREEAARLVAEDKAYEDEGAIRMRMPEEGVTAWDDLIRGRIEWENERLDDLVIVRGDGRPTYNFASPVEDWLDGITHVLRGDDHVSNTPRQIRILEALGAPLPAYGHVANILGPDGKKLSKRHGATSVEEFRAQGYIPEALVNFLALLGWSYDDKTERFTIPELVEAFSIGRVSKSPAVFDMRKLEVMHGRYLRMMPPDAFEEALVDYLRKTGYLDERGPEAEDIARRSAKAVKGKLTKLSEYDLLAGWLYEPLEIQPEAWQRLAGDVKHSIQVIGGGLGRLEGIDEWEPQAIKDVLQDQLHIMGENARDFLEPQRIALTGRTISTGIYESLAIVGRDEAIDRYRRTLGRLAELWVA